MWTKGCLFEGEMLPSSAEMKKKLRTERIKYSTSPSLVFCWYLCSGQNHYRTRELQERKSIDTSFRAQNNAKRQKNAIETVSYLSI
jgi:hypothetical protein